MKITELLENFSRDRYRGKPIAIHFVGRNGRPIEPEHLAFLKKHVKPLSAPRTQYDHYVTEYNANWYQHTDLGKNIYSFSDLKKIIEKYYTFGQQKRLI